MIWKSKIDLEELNRSYKNTMVGHLSILLTEVGDDFLRGTMPVVDFTKQPYGIMHGGASASLAESVGSIAANYTVDREKKFAVGLDLNTSHLKMARDGLVTATAKPLHLGGTVQVWQIQIHNEQDELVSFSRLTMAVLDRR
ncbi:hotdog fold thioesterase [Estrella lausannensis]|uniref:Thioesterase n=1 Tax=Estrella lausannensis TaxID=483423 RepID=A0A0H5DPK4_9BACT|nr:hotdog fold thioesterase [Estrella lausannensis]CRX38501.1 Thioesterase [Estrella lausannensis]